GGWQTFSTDYFNLDSRRRTISRNPGEDGDPDPIDPSRVKFLQGVYANKDQTTVRNEMNDLIGDALAKGRRVFYVLTHANGEAFRRTLDRRRFETKPVGSWNDVPPPLLESEYLP